MTIVPFGTKHSKPTLLDVDAHEIVCDWINSGSSQTLEASEQAQLTHPAWFGNRAAFERQTIVLRALGCYWRQQADGHDHDHDHAGDGDG